MDILLRKKVSVWIIFKQVNALCRKILAYVSQFIVALLMYFRWIKIFLKGCEIWNNMSVMRSFTKNQQNNCQVFSRRCETDCHIEKANWSTKDIQEARNLVSLQSMIWNFMCGYRVDPKSKLNLLNTVSIIYVFH